MSYVGNLLTTSTVNSRNYNFAKNKVLESVGLKQFQYRNARIKDAISKPDIYLSERDAAIKAIEDTAEKKFKDTFQKMLEKGFTHKEAKNLALELTRNEVETQLTILSREFPETLTSVSYSSQAKVPLSIKDFDESRISSVKSKEEDLNA